MDKSSRQDTRIPHNAKGEEIPITSSKPECNFPESVSIPHHEFFDKEESSPHMMRSHLTESRGDKIHRSVALATVHRAHEEGCPNAQQKLTKQHSKRRIGKPPSSAQEQYSVPGQSTRKYADSMPQNAFNCAQIEGVKSFYKEKEMPIAWKAVENEDQEPLGDMCKDTEKKRPKTAGKRTKHQVIPHDGVGNPVPFASTAQGPYRDVENNESSKPEHKRTVYRKQDSTSVQVHHQIPTECAGKGKLSTSCPDSTKVPRLEPVERQRLQRGRSYKRKERKDISGSHAIADIIHFMRNDEVRKKEEVVPQSAGDCQMSCDLAGDRVYVQDMDGFMPISRNKLGAANEGHSQKNNIHYPTPSYAKLPIEVAAIFQKYARKVFTFLHGIIAGFALAQMFLVASCWLGYEDLYTFLDMYAYMSHWFESALLLLSAVCVVSVLDRCDVAHFKTLGVSGSSHYRLRDIFLLFIYFFILITSLLAIQWDDRVGLRRYFNGTLSTTYKETKTAIFSWKNICMCRSIAALIGWIAICLFTSEDMLYHELISLMKVKERQRSSRK